MASLTIIGSGIAGLLLAERMASSGYDAKLVERTAVAGGLFLHTGDGRKTIQQLAERFEISYNTTAVGFEAPNVLLTDSGQIRNDFFVQATGPRELTVGELSIFGERPAGVFGMRSAFHMLDSGLLPGKRVLIYGYNQWSVALSQALANNGAHSEIMGRSAWSPEQDVVLALKGTSRLQSIQLQSAGWRDFDTLILAEMCPHPYLPMDSVGNSAIVIDDIITLKAAVDAYVESVSSKVTHAMSSNVPFFPSRPSGKVVVSLPGPGTLLINDSQVSIRSHYHIFDIIGDTSIRYVRDS